MEKIVTFDQSQSLDDFGPTVEANNLRTPSRNGVVTFPAGKSQMISRGKVGLWCARRAFAFDAISMGYGGQRRVEVHFVGKVPFGSTAE